MRSTPQPKLGQPPRLRTPYLVLAGALLLTSLATYYVAASAEAKDRLRFENSVQHTQDSVVNRLQTYIAMLRAGTGLFAASNSVTRQQFKSYVDRLNLSERYPGIQGIGFSKRVKPDEKEALIAEMRRQGFQDFTIKPEGEREEYHAIIFLEPLDRRNRVAIGFDMFSEPVRHAAMEQARDTGQPAASGKVTLVQEIDEQKQAGFLIYIPVYKKGQPTETVEQRRDALEGFVYSPFRTDDLLEGIFGNEKIPGVAFQVYDGDALTPDNLLHDSRKITGAVDDSYEARFTTVTTINVAGRPWQLAFSTQPDFDLASGRNLAPFIMLGGVMISLVLFAVTRAQARSRAEAEAAAAELRQSESLLRESEARFRALVEQSPLSTQILAPDGRTLRVNRAWEKLFGVTLDQIGDYNILKDEQLIAKGVMPYIEKAFAGEAAEIPPVAYAPNRGPYKGRELWMTAYIYPVKDESGNIREVVLVQEDITERKRAERERAELLAREREARQEAETANRLKDEFLATVSHELRTPLNAILGWAGLLRNGRLDAETAARAYVVIETNAKAQAQLINDILDVSRIITGKVRLEVRQVELAPVVEAAIDSVRPAADAKGIKIKKEIDDQSGLVLGDPDRLQQVVWNLLSNAIKFTPSGGCVEVRLERREVDESLKVNSNEPVDSIHPSSYIEIKVSDTGQGIKSEFLPYVFDRFTQADGSITRKHGGLGLGLAIVRHLVEMHGGTAQAESEGEGRGSTFYVRLPLLKDEGGRMKDEKVSKFEIAASKSSFHRSPFVAHPSLRGLRVMVVDDDADAREVIKAMLAQSGAEVETAASVADALRLFERFKPAVLVSDIAMPEQDGYSLIRAIRSLGSERGGLVPAIALTARVKAEDRERARTEGFQLHLSKPIEPAELVRAVASLVENRAKDHHQ
ncbi:MAG TPA: CHASE domain-containing protein [Blastocatellia bacterium]|nr:CHASE domain-containing protein [Blastocatellia bacterium]